MSLTVNSIENIQATKEIAEDVWKDMAKFAAERDKATFIEDTRALEVAYAEKHFSEEPRAKTSGGKWKKSFKDESGERILIIPGAWNTAKSVIITAMDAGVDYLDRGQTAVAKEAREKLADADKTAYQKVLSRIKSMSILIEQNSFTEEEQENIRGALDYQILRVK